MAFAVVATWHARAGSEEACRDILRSLTPATRAEPACRMYIAQQSNDDPRTFVLYEQFDDEAGFEAHRESEHFKRYVLREAVEQLESRSATFYTTLD